MPQFALLLVCCQQFFGDFVWTIYYVNETMLRQSVAPPKLLGRVNAAMQLASRGMLPIGALAGFLGGKIGIANTFWIGAGGGFAVDAFPGSGPAHAGAALKAAAG